MFKKGKDYKIDQAKLPRSEYTKQKIADSNRDNINAKHSLGLIEGKTVRQWAEHYGVSTTCIYDRLNTHGNPHEQWSHPKKKIIEGKSVRQWADHYGVSKPTIHSRLRTQGHPHTPKKSFIKVKKYEGKTLGEWSEHYGVAESTIRKWIKKYGRPHRQAEVKPVDNFVIAEEKTYNFKASSRLKETTQYDDVYDGKTVREWAEHYNMLPSSLISRIYRYGSPHLPDRTIEGKTKQEWADHYGVGHDSIHRRILKHGHPHPRKTKKWVNKKYVDK